MSCAELRTSLQAYVDRELDGVDREQIEEHLASCAGCARQVHLQGRFKAAVRAHLPRPALPPGFEARMRQALAAQPIAPRRWPWLSYPRLVPALAAAGLLIGLTSTVRQTGSRVLEQAQRSYHAEMPMDITGSDCGSIASWFRGRVDFPVHVPVLGGGATCAGGRLVNVGERPAAYLLYRVQTGHRVALLVFDPRDQPMEAPDRRIIDGREVWVESGPGISTAAYRDRGLGYVVTADLDEDALTRLVTTAFQR
ncbi:MAG TPA: zf-HC2 domain-containing protein [Polyangia bacterium]|nr:zf-HC2 domain-containing protein [Polyangia bacterium]